MSLTRIACAVLAVICSAVLCGCFPPGQNQQDEEKDPHFLAGRSRVVQMDYRGAIEAFAKALEVNPRSARAHFELGILYEEKDPDPAAAIYHYEQYLKLCPGAENAGTVRQRILGLKQELAKAVLPMPSTPAVQRELEQLTEENRKLQEKLEWWQTHYARATNADSILASALNRRAAQITGTPTPAPRNDNQQTVASPRATSGGTAAARTHKVQAGESPVSIARKYGVKLEALMAANPGLNPKRLQIGQTLNVPPP